MTQSKLPIGSNVMVFGANIQGRHGAGAALYAVRHHGAIYGQPRGRQGSSYAIVTKELRPKHPKVTLGYIRSGVQEFLEYARENPELTFNVTRIGCGLAGFTDEQIAPMFKGHPSNCVMPKEWKNFL